jgi:3-dehydroquinate dehydratase-2
VEVHLSNIDEREPFRRESVIRDLCFARVAGKGQEGYREALTMLQEQLSTPV